MVPIPAGKTSTISQGTTWKCNSWHLLQSHSATLSIKFRGPLAHGRGSTLRIIMLEYASPFDSFTIHPCVRSLRRPRGSLGEMVIRLHNWPLVPGGKIRDTIPQTVYPPSLGHFHLSIHSGVWQWDTVLGTPSSGSAVAE